uniref:MAT1 centre domain-containing protein n=1 Tax=Babesia bovis TaxID=5865 RepID=S6BLY0_BABBO|nr:hypothetical protein [Babesia bovis]
MGHAQCAICRTHISWESFSIYDNTKTYYQTVKEARKRVLQVYNDTRSNFKDTPDYNAFLEKRENLVINLTYGRSDPRWEQADAELKAYESQNAAKISSNMALQENELRKRVKHIVDTEKTFYEMVDKSAPFNLWKVDDLVHTLQRTHASYFIEEKAIMSSKGECVPLNASIRSTADIPRRVMTTRDEVLECDIAGGYDIKLVKQRCERQVELLLLWNLS